MQREKCTYTLKELRARKDMTQAEVAQELGISVQTYNAWEKDISNIAVSKVKALAKYFGVNLNEIFLQTDLNNIQVSDKLN